MSGSIASGVKIITEVEKESAWFFGKLYFESFMLKMRYVDQALLFEAYEEAYNLLKQEYLKLQGFVKINSKTVEICDSIDTFGKSIEQKVLEYMNYKVKWQVPSQQKLHKLTKMKQELKLELDRYYGCFMQLFTELGMFMPTQTKDTKSGIEKFQDKYIDKRLLG